jgi:predicted amidohydrolase
MARVVCQQLAPRIGDLAANRLLTVNAVRDAIVAGADLVLLPELATSGYCFTSREEAVSVAITTKHPLFEEWAAELGRGALVVAGFCEFGGDGLLYNSAALVDQSGIVTVYRKIHLWDREKLVFQGGEQPPPVVDTALGRIGIVICYDLEFPELTRGLALRGADLIVAPSNWPLVDRPAGERPPEVVAAMAAARANHVFIACCDRTSDERGVSWTNGTALINELGWVVSTVEGEGMASADFDLEQARAKALGPRNDALADRRPELYSDITDREHVDASV